MRIRLDFEAGDALSLEDVLGRVERAYLKHVVEFFDYRKSAAAAALGISRKNLWEKSRKHDLPLVKPGFPKTAPPAALTPATIEA